MAYEEGRRNFMMSCSKRFLSICVTSILTVLCIVVGASAAVEVPEYTIDTPYEYPVTRDSVEWHNFQTREERLAACHVDDEILQNMTTPALVETVLDYPMLSDLYVYDTLEEGIDAISRDFSGIRELEKRDDALVYLQSRAVTRADENADITNMRAECLMEYLGETVSLSSEVSAYATRTSVKTPKGTSVSAYKDMTWSDHGTSKAAVLVAQKDIEKTYTNATRIADISPTYNCHSYAWYSQSTSNRYWINDPSSYMEDGSYTKHSTPKSEHRPRRGAFALRRGR